MSLRLAVILGSVRRERIGIRVARYAVTALRERGHEVTLVDPLEYDLPLLDLRYADYDAGTAPETLERLAGVLREADGFVLVSAEYNNSIPPALSNLLDHFVAEYAHKPSAIVCYSAGPFGGVRAAMQLRAMTAQLGMSSIPSLLPCPVAHEMFAEDGMPTGPRPGKSGARFFAELEWYAQALKAARAAGLPA